MGPYRDRLVVELAQNGCDAGASTLWLSFDGTTLVARNDGAPLTPEGVEALASLRASAKREGRTVGRFGVGFASVAAVSDEVAVLSTDRSVGFSRARTREAVRELPALADELARREAHVPLLRLPFPAPGAEQTEVRVVVRPDCRARVQDLLDAVDPRLLLVLPGLTRLVVQDREMTAVEDGPEVVVGGTRWRVVRAAGDLDPALLTGRPVEEQAQTRWSVTWALPAEGKAPGVVWAPTPTDDPLSLPALLSASLPLGPDRRRVQLGPLAQAVLRHAAAALVDLLATLPFEPGLLAFVPSPLAAGEVDAVLGACLLPELGRLLGPRHTVLEGATPALVELLDEVLEGLLPHEWSGSRWAGALARLGVRRLSLAELTEVLAGVDRPPSWWGALYAALPPDVEQLGALPVPLASGTMAPSPRGLLLTDTALDLGPLGFRTVHADATHPLLLRLGAQHTEPRALLEDPRVRSVVESLEDAYDDEQADVARAVLELVGAADLRPGELPWLAALPLPTVEGDRRPAGELLLPGGPLASVVDLSAGFGVVADGVAHPDVLAAVGVLRDFAVLPAEEADGVDLLEEWLMTVAEPGPVVRDLDLVRPDAWDRALELLPMTDYVVWWLRRHPVLDGERPDRLRCKGSEPLLAGLLDERDHPLVTTRALADVPAEVLLERLAVPDRTVGRKQLRALYAHLATREVEHLPDHVRAVLGGELVVVPAEDAVVVDRPDLLARVAPYAVVPVPLELADRLAEALDLPLASEVLADARLMESPDADGFVAHDRLEVPDAGGAPVRVTWARVGAVDHVVGLVGRARALAWRAGQWDQRDAILARLRGEGNPADADLDPVP